MTSKNNDTPLVALLDGNEAVARVAYVLNEVIAIYPITPASALSLDSKALTTQVEDFLHSETRFNSIQPEVAAAVQHEAEARRKMYQYMADRK